MSESTSSIILNKKPILKQDKSLFAYQVSVDQLEGEFDEAALLEKLTALYDELDSAGGLELMTQSKPIFFRIDKHFLGKACLPKVSETTHLIIEVDNTILGDKAALTKLRELAAEGMPVAVNFTDKEKDVKLLACAQYIKVSAKDFSAEQIATHLSAFEGKPIILTDVESDETLLQYQDLSLSYFQGYYFTDPIIKAGNEPDANQLVLIKLLAEVNTPDVSIDEIVKTVQIDTILSHKLISAINHPQNNLPHYVDNLKDAVSFMGLKKLSFWINLLIMSQIKDIPKELLVTALIRAKFLESIAYATEQSDAKDRFFMVGLFSTLNAFLKVAMIDIVEKLPITEEIKTALTSQSGTMGQALFIVKALEQGNTQLISMGFENLGVMEVSSNYMKANGWAYQTIASLDQQA